MSYGYILDARWYQMPPDFIEIPDRATRIDFYKRDFYWNENIQRLKFINAISLDFLVIDYDCFEGVFPYCDSASCIPFVAFCCSGHEFTNCFRKYHTISVAILEPVKDEIYEWILDSTMICNVFIALKVLSTQSDLFEKLRQSQRQITIQVLESEADIFQENNKLFIKSDCHLSDAWLTFGDLAKIKNVIVGGKKCLLDVEKLNITKDMLKITNQQLSDNVQQIRTTNDKLNGELSELVFQITQITNYIIDAVMSAKQ